MKSKAALATSTALLAIVFITCSPGQVLIDAGVTLQDLGTAIGGGDVGAQDNGNGNGGSERTFTVPCDQQDGVIWSAVASGNGIDPKNVKSMKAWICSSDHSHCLSQLVTLQNNSIKTTCREGGWTAKFTIETI